MRTKITLLIAFSISALNIQASSPDKMEHNKLIFPAENDKTLVCMTVTEHAVDGHVVQLSPVTDAEYVFSTTTEKEPAMCAKLPMSSDGIIRLSKVEVDPAYLDEYIKFATEVGEISLRTEPGVLTMYAVQEKDRPNIITILETYASQEAYKSHINSAHFQKYKQGTLHMVKDLQLIDQKELNPVNRIINTIEKSPAGE